MSLKPDNNGIITAHGKELSEAYRLRDSGSVVEIGGHKDPELGIVIILKLKDFKPEEETTVKKKGVKSEKN